MEHQGKEKFGHAERADRKQAGATYTPAKLAAAVALRLTEGADMPMDRPLRILDPGCGDGTLTEALLSGLTAAQAAAAHVTCIDLDPEALRLAEARLAARFPATAFEFRQEDFIAFAARQPQGGGAFDLVIANPPYVRIQALAPELRARLKSRYDLGGRTDLSYAFLLAIAGLLPPGGRAGVIVSNRVLTTEASKPLRKQLLDLTRMTEVWDLGDSKLFDAAVLPAVLFFESVEGATNEASEPDFTSLYEVAQDEDAALTADLCADLTTPGLKRLACGRTYEQKRGTLETSGAWRLGSSESRQWIEQVQRATWKRFGEIAKISVGIKSTADKVFISQGWPEPRPELLRPLITHHVAGRYRASAKPDREVLYTHELRDGRRRAVDLPQYPASQMWLEQHRAQLEGRSYVAKAGREWFEIWVPHSPDDWRALKIVFRDIAERPTFWVDESGAVVNGDCYWLRLCEGNDPDLVWLMLAVANSAFIERFYDTQFNERLYAGRRRFMTRHVQEFPLPHPDHPEARNAARLARALALGATDRTDVEKAEQSIDDAILAAFGLTRPSGEA